MSDTGYSYDGDRALAIHPLVYFTDGGEVTIGRPDIDSYGIFPQDGAELVRRLEAGSTPDQAAQWYATEYGETASIGHVVAALDELGFLRNMDEQPVAAAGPLRWQRLGRAVFSPPTWIAYGAVIAWAIVAMVRLPALVPDYHDIFFTRYYSLIEIVLLIGAVPLIMLHESFHALAARRLGLRSRLTISQRFYYIVMETALDGLVVVPRCKRYLPIMAGMIIDTVMLGAFIIAADLTRGRGAVFSFTARLCLAFAFAILLRVLWQFFFYVKTDLYVLISTVLGCVDLHATAMRMLTNRIKRGLGLHSRVTDESDRHPVDLRVAQWYSWLILAGYLTSLGTFIFAVGPVTVHMFAGALGRFAGGHDITDGQLLDSAVFLGFNATQVAFTAWLAVRARAERRRSRLQHVIT